MKSWLKSVRYHDGEDGETPPWIEDGVKWRPERIFIFKMVTAQGFEALMGFIILFNIALIWWETDFRAQCYPTYAAELEKCPYDPDREGWLVVSNWVLLGVYTIEAMLRIFAQRTGYFKNRWNLLDFGVVCVAWITVGVQDIAGVGFLRVFRMTRLVRAIRIVLSVRELYMLVTGLASSMKAIFFGTVLLLTVLCLWSIILVDFVHPLNASIDFGTCERCSMGFKSVGDSVLTLFQTIIAGDSWGTIAVPLIESYPVTSIIMVAVLISVSLGIMNLILAVIVESAAEARERDIEEKQKQRARDQKRIKMEVDRVFKDIDKDETGRLCTSDLRNAWEISPCFKKIMMSLNLTKADLDAIFSILDADDSGEIEYSEFYERLLELQTCDWRMLVGMQRHDMKLLQADMNRQLERQSRTLGSLHGKVSALLRQFPDASPEVPQHCRTILTGLSLSGTTSGDVQTERGEELAPSETTIPQSPTTGLRAIGEAEAEEKSLGGLSCPAGRLEILASFLENRHDDRQESCLESRHDQLVAGVPISRVTSDATLVGDSVTGCAIKSSGTENWELALQSLADACSSVVSKALEQQALLFQRKTSLEKAMALAKISPADEQARPLAGCDAWSHHFYKFEQALSRQIAEISAGHLALSRINPASLKSAADGSRYRIVSYDSQDSVATRLPGAIASPPPPPVDEYPQFCSEDFSPRKLFLDDRGGRARGNPHDPL